MEKLVVDTNTAPTPIGQYSQGIVAKGNLLFVAGQVGIDPKTGSLRNSGAKEEIRQTFENIKSIIEAAGSSMDLLVKTLTFVKDLRIYDVFKEVRSEYLPKEKPPVNSFVQVANLQLNASIEIEAVALIP